MQIGHEITDEPAGITNCRGGLGDCFSIIHTHTQGIQLHRQILLYTITYLHSCTKAVMEIYVTFSSMWTKRRWEVCKKLGRAMSESKERNKVKDKNSWIGQHISHTRHSRSSTTTDKSSLSRLLLACMCMCMRICMCVGVHPLYTQPELLTLHTHYLNYSPSIHTTWTTPVKIVT